MINAMTPQALNEFVGRLSHGYSYATKSFELKGSMNGVTPPFIYGT